MPRAIENPPPPDAPILITMGEPAGIGPEVAVAAWHALGGRIGKHALKLVGAASVFRAQGDVPQTALIDSHALGAPLRLGHADPANTHAVVDAIDTAVAMAMQGAASAVVTAPIHKAVLAGAGFGFPGHTEFLASLTGAKHAVMMLASDKLKVTGEAARDASSLRLLISSVERPSDGFTWRGRVE